jgi:hypothetical protein
VLGLSCDLQRFYDIANHHKYEVVNLKERLEEQKSTYQNEHEALLKASSRLEQLTEQSQTAQVSIHELNSRVKIYEIA